MGGGGRGDLRGTWAAAMTALPSGAASRRRRRPRGAAVTAVAMCHAPRGPAALQPRGPGARAAGGAPPPGARPAAALPWRLWRLSRGAARHGGAGRRSQSRPPRGRAPAGGARRCGGGKRAQGAAQMDGTRISSRDRPPRARPQSTSPCGCSSTEDSAHGGGKGRGGEEGRGGRRERRTCCVFALRRRGEGNGRASNVCTSTAYWAVPGVTPGPRSRCCSGNPSGEQGFAKASPVPTTRRHAAPPQPLSSLSTSQQLGRKRARRRRARRA